MSGPVRVGLVSTSWWAELMHVPALQSHPEAQLVAVCGRNAERIADAGLEALVVAAPEEAHHDVCMAGIEAGLHVLCEKPLAMTETQAKSMAAAAGAAGIVHMTYFTWRWMPWFRYLKELVENGYVGKVYESSFRSTGGYGRNGAYHWKWDQRHGLGAVGDLGSHMIDLAHWLIGDVTNVSASLEALVKRPPPDESFEPANDSALLNLQFEDGSHGVVHVSALTHLGSRAMEWEVRLYGESGSLGVTMNLADGWKIWGLRSEENEIQYLDVPASMMEGVQVGSPVAAQFGQIFTKQAVGCRLFIDCIRAGHQVMPSFADGYKAQRVIETAFASESQGRRLSIREVCGGD
ncbi:MAG: Gfo/Idh/MocA family oxidoreductase [Candidatus Latescibacteria bacterium]|nr:Gfo/Idh/MocA family oxidoreductase [Candidatus Latescibacterota bacterium]